MSATGASHDAALQIGFVRRFASIDFRFQEYRHPGGHRIPVHRHAGPVAVLALEGGFDWHDRRRGTDRCAAGSLALVPPTEAHSETVLPDGSRSLIIKPAESPEEAGVLRPERLVLEDPRTHLAAVRCRLALAIADELTGLDLDALAHELFRAGLRKMRRRVVGTPAWLRRVRDRLNDEYAGRHTLADLARDAGVSRSLLAAEFRAAFGTTVGTYVRQLRVGRAARRLATDRTVSVRDVAMDCGFYDQSHFTAAFRRLVGVTPRRYRLAVTH